MEDIEVWKKIDGYDNYEVSSWGNVKNSKTGRILRVGTNGGYCCVGLHEGSVRNSQAVHRLVAKAFISNPENKPQVNHIDKNGLNNRLENLEWVTNKENCIHRSSGVQQTTNQNIKIHKINPITQTVVETYPSIEEGAKSVLNENDVKLKNVCSGISMAVNKRQKTAYGYIWQKVDEDLLEGEEWREVSIPGKDTEGYFVSSLGRFKNRKGVIMKDYKPHHSGYIYLRVNIDKYALHRIVAFTFIPNPDPETKLFVNHIDGNKTNNAVSNLEWVTCAENNLHNHKAGILKCYSRKIAQYDLEMNEIKKFDKIVDASRELNICCSGIKHVLYKKQKTFAGFIWKYLD